MTIQEAIAELSARRADYARLGAQVSAAGLLDDVLGVLARVTGAPETAARDLTSREAAVALGMRNHRTIERYCRAGRFSGAYKTSGGAARGADARHGAGDWRIPAADLTDFRRSAGRAKQ